MQPDQVIPHAVEVALQHPCIAQQAQLVCRLLCTSKSMAASVLTNCARQLRVSTPTNYGPGSAFVQWVAHNGVLIDILSAGPVEDGYAALGEAFRQAAAAAKPPGLRVQTALLLAGSGTGLVRLLQGLCTSNTLRNLSIDVLPPASLYLLTGLRTLDLTCYDSHHKVHSDLSMLTNLTMISAGDLRHYSTLSILPPSLLEVQLEDVGTRGARGVEKDREPLDLSHLTSCTFLRFCGSLRARDVLPISIDRLVVTGCHSSKPLLRLHRLRCLECTWKSVHTMPALELQQLTRLAALSTVQLRYEGWGAMHVNVAIGGLGCLPMTELVLQQTEALNGPRELLPAVNLPATLAVQLSLLSRHLTHVSMSNVSIIGISSQHFAASLAQLTGLEKLSLLIYGVTDMNADHALQLDDTASVMKAIAALPKLESIILGIDLHASAAPVLASMTRLTSLELHKRSMQLFSACEMGIVLGGLRNLCALVINNPSVRGGELLQQVTHNLVRLRWLFVVHTTFDDSSDMHCLTKLRCLSLLFIMKCPGVARADLQGLDFIDANGVGYKPSLLLKDAGR